MHTKRETPRKRTRWLALAVTSSLMMAACSAAADEAPNKMVPQQKIEAAVDLNGGAESEPAEAESTEPEPAEPESVDDPESKRETIPEFVERNGGLEKGKIYEFVWDPELEEYVPGGVTTIDPDIEAEREAFWQRQQMPSAEPLWSAVTEEQHELVNYVRDFRDSTGGVFNEYDEDLLLFMGIEACMAAIDNGHEIDMHGFEEHVAGSEMIQHVVTQDDGDRFEFERRLVNLMTIGMNFLCSDDHDDWRALYLEKYE